MALCHLGDRQLAVVEMIADVGHDRPEPRGCDPASFRNCPAAARGGNGRCDEILHVVDCKSLQFGRRERQIIGNGTGIGDEQAQRFRVMWHEAYGCIVEPTKERCYSLARHSAADEARGRRPDDAEPGATSGRKKSVAVA